MKQHHYLILGALLALGSACGDDDGGATDTGAEMAAGDDMATGEDMAVSGVNDSCPSFFAESSMAMAPGPQNQMGNCCWRASNEERPEAPELRIAGLAINAPNSLAIAANIALPDLFDNETFNWLIEITGADADGEVSIRTGFGRRQDGGTFTFDTGEFPPGVQVGTITGDVVTSGIFDSVVSVPVVDVVDPNLVLLTLPLRDLVVNRAPLDANRNCIGTRDEGTNRYALSDDDPSAGSLSAFITVEDSFDATLELTSPVTLSVSLCNVTRGALDGGTNDCREIPQSDWMVMPDSLCGADGCSVNTEGMTDACDPTTNAADGGCNAWQITATFAAQGVEIN
ncbi:MAG: hypothetical protein AAF411_03895 [Myxococcota bacterium]